MHRGVAKALIEAKKRGVDIELIVDPYSVKVRSPLKKMADAQIPIFVWNPPPVVSNNRWKQQKPLMHEKFCIFGRDTIWTGSFNFTFQADTANCENVIVLENRGIATQYL